MKLYETLAAEFASQIERDILQAGERIPSVRQASLHYGMSVSTVIRAYLLLESRGLVESRPQKGYFVLSRSLVPGPAPARPRRSPLELVSQPDVGDLMLLTLRAIELGSVPFGSPYPDPALFPFARINQYVSSVGRRHRWSLESDLPPGNPELIRQIARRHLKTGLAVDPGEIIVTTGASEAIDLCLQAVARPGAAIAVESPCCHTVRQAIDRAGMRAVAIPVDAGTGIDLHALERAIVHDGIAAAVVMPNFQNPLGVQASDAHKRALVDLMHAHQLPLIESGALNELHFGDSYPKSLKHYDRDGLVLHCNSLSHCLTSAYRIGWTLPGRYRARVEKLKFVNGVRAPSLPQLAIAHYLRREGYDRHLRRLRKHLAQQARLMAHAVKRFFPPGTTVSEPAGGYQLWVGMPDRVSALRLYARALERNITLWPGNLFASGPDFQHHIRLNFSHPWSPDTEAALKTLGLLARELVPDTARRASFVGNTALA